MGIEETVKLLFISHRIPYPPNKGDKIRSYNILRYLAKRHDVYLACLVDDPQDLSHLNALKPLVHDVIYDTINPLWKKIRSSLVLLGSKPMSIPYFYSRSLQKEIDELLNKIDIEAIYCFSSPTAEYLFRSRHYNGKLRQSKWIMDLIDVDSDKWRQYAETCRYPMRWIYQRESKSLLRYEAKIAEEFDHVLLVSESEKKFFLTKVHAHNVTAMANGVDLDQFSPKFCPTLRLKGRALVFTGAMDYWPNIDGATWFVREVLPYVQKFFPDVTLYIVGHRPSPEVQRLSRLPGVFVTGFVKDVRDYLSSGEVCIVPLRIARGIQNKVIEAMAMGKCVVATSEAFEGIDAIPGKDLIVAPAEPNAFSEAILSVLRDSTRAQETARNARIAMEKTHSWNKRLETLETLIH